MDGHPQEEADFSSLPVLDRITHKNWKARVSAYNELAHTFKTSIAEDTPEFNPYLRDPSILAAALKDANAVAQEQGIICACAFIEYGGKAAASSSKEAFTSAIVEKNIFGTSRAGSKKAIVELCLLLVECDNNADTVFEAACIEGLKSKQPKAVAGAVLTMKEIVKQFGVKTINVKPILKTINTIFAHPDKGVRAEGTQLVQELHRWLGSALDPHLADLKPVQQKELTESFIGEEKGIQTRYTRTQQRERALKEAEATLTANRSEQVIADDAQQEDEPETEQIDAYDLSEPQAVLNKLPADFYTNLASAKWKDRKELALDPLLEVLKKTPRIQDGNYEELVRALAGRMTDANIACVISAAGCIEYLAKGLRQDFGRYKSVSIPPILERCKEKKASVTDGLGSALDGIFMSVAISDIVEDITTFAKHKNPQVKEQTYRFLIRSLSVTKVGPSIKTDLKPLADALLAGMDDGFAPVRDAAAEGLGTLHKIVGERIMGAVLDGLDDIKKKKVLEFASKAEVRCKALPSNTGPVASTSSRVKGSIAIKPAVPRVQPNALPLSPGGSDKENSRPPSAVTRAVGSSMSSKPTPATASAPAIRRPPVLSSAKKPAQSVTMPTPSGKNVAPAKSAQVIAHKPSVNEPLKYRYTQEDAEAQASGLFPGATLAELSDSAWKVRLAAMDTLQAWVEGEGKDADPEVIIRVLSKSPGWKESNFQVYGKMATLFTFMATNMTSWSRACSALTIGPLSDKLGDIKIKKSAGDALIAYAEAFSLQFALSHAYDPMTKQKAPKSQSEALIWLDQVLRDFGVAGLAVRDLVEFLKTGLKSSNAAVRTSAIKTLVTLRLFVGPDIKTFLQDLNPTLLTTIDTEFDKVSGETSPEPTRQSADNVQTTVQMSGKGTTAQSDTLDDLFPRQDIAKLVSPATVKAMGDANWKQRKEALENIQGVLAASTRLKPNLGELANALKMRLPDSNKVVQGLALDVIARLANGMNKPFERFAKVFVPSICGILADAKVSVRAPALAALDAIYDQCGLDCILPQAALAIEVANPVQRSEVASWIAGKLKSDQSDCDLRPLITPIIGCLEDKAADVRKAAQSLLPCIISNTGYAPVLEKASGLKPASRSVILPILENAKASVSQASNSATSVHSRPASVTSGTLPANGRAPASSSASRPLAAVTRNLKVQDTSSSTSRAGTPVSRPISSTSEVPVGTPKTRRPAQSNVIANRANTQPVSHQPESIALFRTADESGKQARAMREVGPLKWLLDGTARSDQIDYLHQQTIPHVSEDLVTRMFSRDHSSDRDHLTALVMLTEAAQAAKYDEGDVVASGQEDARKQLLANSDLILKYLTVRFGDTSSSIHLQCLDLLENLLHVMLLASYHLSDYEAAAFLPSLVAKLGDAKETIRSRTRSIIRSLGSIYPSSKVFAQLLDQASRAKSARVRSESIEELGNLIQRQGLGVCQPSKALPEIAALLTDKDASSRSAALDALAQAYAQIGEDVFGYVGELAPKEQTLLEERLKRTAMLGTAEATRMNSTGTPKRPASRQSLLGPSARIGSGKIPAATSTASRLPSSAISARRTSTLPAPLGSSVRKQAQISASLASQTSMATFPSGPVETRMMTDEAMPNASERSLSVETNDPFAAIESRSTTQSIDALKKVQKAIVEDPESLEAQASPLIDAISSQMAFAFEGLDQDTPQSVLRLCKHLMQTLSGFFDNKYLSLAVPKATLARLLGELTKQLLETADSGASEAIVSLSKVLNMVLIRIFHNSDNSACFGSLFLILERVTLNLRDLQGQELASRAKYAELVMKCLWKISKSVKDNLVDGSLDAKKLLLDIDRFLQAIPPAEWRRRASDNVPLDDMPLRTVKTILQSVVGTYGDGVYDQLSLLERAENSFVYQYLFRLLNNSRTASASDSTPRSVRQSASSLKAAPGHSDRTRDQEGSNGQEPTPGMAGVTHTESATMSPRSNDIEMNLALKDIFDKIGNAADSKRGIAELYEFKKEHPEAEARINNWIAATGSFFQSYLRRALSNLANEEADRVASHSTPSSPSGSRPVSYFPSAPSSPRTGAVDHSSPAKNRNSSPRVSSSAMTAGDERLDSLKQMFGVSRLNAAR